MGFGVHSSTYASVAMADKINELQDMVLQLHKRVCVLEKYLVDNVAIKVDIKAHLEGDKEEENGGSGKTT